MSDLKELVGKKIKKVFVGEQGLSFETDQGDLHYYVYGDCCSSSYMHDFIGVKNLLANSEVKAVEEIENTDEGFETDCCKNCKEGESINYYGYRIITEGELGEVSSVLSFRNSSNGYYGGSLDSCDEKLEGLEEIQDDYFNV